MTRKYVVTLEDTLKGWQEDDWIYDGDSRPRNCPLMEIPTDSESEDKA